ncbi:MAG: DUF2164 domain-containing protein [Pseudomonadota bacterium]
MSKPDFTADEKEIIVQKVKQYFRDQLEQDIGGFDAEFLIDFFAEEIGAYFYNRGLHDAQALFARKVDEFSDAVYELERPVNSIR